MLHAFIKYVILNSTMMVLQDFKTDLIYSTAKMIHQKYENNISEKVKHPLITDREVSMSVRHTHWEQLQCSLRFHRESVDSDSVIALSAAPLCTLPGQWSEAQHMPTAHSSCISTPRMFIEFWLWAGGQNVPNIHLCSPQFLVL